MSLVISSRLLSETVSTRQKLKSWKITFIISKTQESCRATSPCRILVINCLTHAFHSDLGFGYDVEQEDSSKSFGGQHSWRFKTNFLPFLSKDKNRSIPPPFMVFIYSIIYFTLMYVHLSIGVQWNPRLHYGTLPVYPFGSKCLDRMAMLSNLGLR
jgi:hypothetical protein